MKDHERIEHQVHPYIYIRWVGCIALMDFIILTTFIFQWPVLFRKRTVGMNEYIVEVLSGITVAILAWLAGMLYGRILGAKKARDHLKASPRKYVEHLGKAIKAAANEGPQNAIINARAILAIRDSIRPSMIVISQLLNSEIDLLATQVGGVTVRLKIDSERRDKDDPNFEEIYKTLLVLDRSWAIKRDQIEDQIRKLIVELRLDEFE